VLPSVDHPEMVADDIEAVDYASEKSAERNGDSDATVVMESLPAELEEQLARKNSADYRPVPPPASADASPRDTAKPTD
jgi:hypothetical protein